MATTNKEIEDPLSSAMDMLDTLGGADLGDFAIDDDDDEEEIGSGIDNTNGEVVGTNNTNTEEERGISDFSFGDIDLNLEDVAIVSESLDTDLHNGKPVTVTNHNNNKPSVNNVPNNNEEEVNKTSQDEIDALRNNLQGTSSSTGAASSTISTKLQAPKSTDVANAGDWHPLQDVGSTTATTTAQPTHTSSAAPPNSSRTDNNNSSSWSTTLSTFATKAAKHVQVKSLYCF